MTNEELEKDYYADRPTEPYSDDSPNDWANIAHYAEENLEKAFKRIAELEEKLANADYQLEGRDNEIRELEAQIEKMKCCYNCSKWNEGLLLCNDSTVRIATYADYCCKDWEIKEIKEK